MFTGIVEATARVAGVEVTGDGARIWVEHPMAAGVSIGDSVAINGTCLTVVDHQGGAMGFDVVNESLDRTNLGGLEPGAAVNVERAMPADGRFDGHIVQGHVDGTVAVRNVTPEGGGVRVWFDVPRRLMRFIVEKGSVTLDGVSLTVADLDDEGFAVALIPHTMAATTLGRLEPEQVVNAEADVLAKYVERLMDGRSRA